MSSSKTISFFMADQLIEDLAKRRKLTSTILQLLQQSRLTRLNLMCLRSIDDEPKFLEQLANQRHVVDIDLSFSPCLASCRFRLIVRALSSSCSRHNQKYPLMYSMYALLLIIRFVIRAHAHHIEKSLRRKKRKKQIYQVSRLRRESHASATRTHARPTRFSRLLKNRLTKDNIYHFYHFYCSPG